MARRGPGRRVFFPAGSDHLFVALAPGWIST
jgi:hypothetical protein